MKYRGIGPSERAREEKGMFDTSTAAAHRDDPLTPQPLDLAAIEASDAATGARKASTETVLRSHLRAATIGVDAIMEDYTDDSVLVTHDATYRGPAEIRGFFDALWRELPAGFFGTIEMIRQEIVGEDAYIVWAGKPIISRATDTFVVRNGKIVFQTFTAVAP
jgi:hypothetical protein